MIDYNALQNMWETTEAQEYSGFITPPDGDYIVAFRAITSEEKTVQGNTDPYLAYIWTYEILDGEQKGRSFRKFSELKSKKAIGFFKGELKKLFPAIPSQIEHILPALTTLIGKRLNITVKTQPFNGKDYKSVYVNGFAEGETPIGDVLQSSAAPTFSTPNKKANIIYDDDVPF